MAQFYPEKLHVQFDDALRDQAAIFPRCYTLTHSDRTGSLFLTIAPTHDLDQVSDWYTQLMRDEVMGEWAASDPPSLHLHCHVSGGFVLGPAKWRAAIFRQHLPLVLEALCYGDRIFLHEHSFLLDAPILVHFHARQKALDTVEDWGSVGDWL